MQPYWNISGRYTKYHLKGNINDILRLTSYYPKSQNILTIMTNKNSNNTH